MTLTDVNVSIDLEVTEKPVVLCRYGHDRVFKTVTQFKRTSGALDEILLNFPDTLGVVINSGDFIHVEGELRSSKDGNAVFIYAKEISVLEAEPEKYENLVEINGAELKAVGTLCKHKDGSASFVSCKFELLRKHSRRALIGAVCWNTDAMFIMNTATVGDKYNFKGRLQRHVTSAGKGYTEVSVWYLDTAQE